jgi:hypothetical protein
MAVPRLFSKSRREKPLWFLPATLIPLPALLTGCAAGRRSPFLHFSPLLPGGAIKKCNIVEE